MLPLTSFKSNEKPRSIYKKNIKLEKDLQQLEKIYDQSSHSFEETTEKQEEGKYWATW